jgi:hypothetical protein
MTDATWPDIPPELRDRWGDLSNHTGPVYVITHHFSGSPPPVYGVIVSNKHTTWSYGQWGSDDETEELEE